MTPPAASILDELAVDLGAMLAVAQTAGGEQDRVDLHRAQLAQVVQLLVGIAIGVADERDVAVGVRLVLDAPCDLAEVLVHHVVDHHGDGLGPAARETAGQHVGLEVERSCAASSTFARVACGDRVRRTAQHPRHGGRRHHREGGDVLERRHVSLPPERPPVGGVAPDRPAFDDAVEETFFEIRRIVQRIHRLGHLAGIADRARTPASV